jgi:phospholipid/cholesterol/gamma-HCH transport system ATP-binding protein
MSSVSEREVVIRVRGLAVGFDRHLVLENTNLDLYRNEILGVVGGSGTGKSLLLRAILGLIPYRAGRIEIFGRDVATLNSEQRRHTERRFGVLFQGGALFSSLTVAENVAVPLREHIGLTAALADEIAAVKLALVGLDPAADGGKYPSELSGGMTKRAALARAIALDPEVLFLDEPTGGLDPIGAAAFDRLIQDLTQTLGLTLFMVTHDLDSLATICDRIAVLADRRVLATGSIEELRAETHPWVRAYFHGPRAAHFFGPDALSRSG